MILQLFPKLLNEINILDQEDHDFHLFLEIEFFGNLSSSNKIVGALNFSSKMLSMTILFYFFGMQSITSFCHFHFFFFAEIKIDQLASQNKLIIVIHAYTNPIKHTEFWSNDTSEITGDAFSQFWFVKTLSDYIE